MRTFQKPSEDAGDFILAPAGVTAATLITLSYLGKHESTWQGQVRERELVGLSWELAERGPDGRGLSVTETLTASLHPKAVFYSRVLALTGGQEPPPGFNLAELLGRSAIVTIQHAVRGDRTYANVGAVGPLPRGMSAPPPTVGLTFYDIEAHDPAAYAALPARFRKLADIAMATGGQASAPAAPWSPPAGYPPAPPAAPWQGSHQAPGAWPPGPQATRPPAPPAGGPDFNDDFPF